MWRVALCFCVACGASEPEQEPNIEAEELGAEAPSIEEPEPTPAEEGAEHVYPQIREVVRADVLPQIEAITPERRETLDRVASFLRSRIDAGERAEVTFVCTHNSRRSHLAQLWAGVAAAWYGVDLKTYSGGTESTAFNPRAVASMRRAGFQIEDAEGENPRYEVRAGEDLEPWPCWSKLFDDEANPQQDFVAVMTCTAADESCPFVAGAGLRVGLPYDDPKASDGTAEEAATYDARSREIAAEMFYLARRVAG